MRVQAYKNLNNGKWSIRAGGTVLGHCDAMVLNNVDVKISAATHARVRAKGTREVFAVLVGDLVSVEGFEGFKGRTVSTCDAFPLAHPSQVRGITFHPFSDQMRGFIWRDDDSDYLGSRCAYFNSCGRVFAA